MPQNGDGFLRIPVHGDGLSIEGMRDPKAARVGSLTAAGRTCTSGVPQACFTDAGTSFINRFNKRLHFTMNIR